MKRYDLIIIGAGPAGLSAAVNAGSEGLDVLLIESTDKVGGQSRFSAAIENYLGFHRGITGEQFANAALRQCKKFKIKILFNHPVTSITIDGKDRIVVVSDTLYAVGRSVLICCGLEWRRAQIDGITEIPRSVLYGGNKDMARFFKGKKVIILGGGNSAGQAAIRWRQYADVKVVARQPIEKTMSQYLVDEINGFNLPVYIGAELTQVISEHGRAKTCVFKGAPTQPCDLIIPMIGSVPNTAFVSEVCDCDEAGFLLAPKVPGIFCAGDCKRDTTKRIAVAVGDAAGQIQEVHRYLSTL